MHEFYLQKMIYLQFVKYDGDARKTPRKNKIEPKKTLFGYPPIPPSKIWKSIVF